MPCQSYRKLKPTQKCLWYCFWRTVWVHPMKNRSLDSVCRISSTMCWRLASCSSQRNLHEKSSIRSSCVGGHGWLNLDLESASSRDFGRPRGSWLVSGHPAEHQQLASWRSNREGKSLHIHRHVPHTCQLVLELRKGTIYAVNLSQNRVWKYVEPNKWHPWVFITLLKVGVVTKKMSWLTVI